jgi:hypothetical protein
VFARIGKVSEVTNEEAKMFEELEGSFRELEEQEGRILGKFSHPECERPSRRLQCSLVTKTKPPCWVFSVEGRGR